MQALWCHMLQQALHENMGLEPLPLNPLIPMIQIAHLYRVMTDGFELFGIQRSAFAIPCQIKYDTLAMLIAFLDPYAPRLSI
jgi:hypothetical protein